jgi:hypothetical protein
MEEVNEASLEHFVESNQEDVTEFFIEEEEENPTESEPSMKQRNPRDLPLSLNLYYLVLDMPFCTMILSLLRSLMTNSLRKRLIG